MNHARIDAGPRYAAKYRQALASIPAPGGGAGCHSALLGVANYGVLAGLSDVQIAEDIRGAIPPGSRHISDLEVADTVCRARCDFDRAEPVRAIPRRRPRFDGRAARRQIIAKGRELGHEADIWESSPIRIDWLPEQDAVELLRRLYQPDDVLFIGTRYDKGAETVKPVGEWVKVLEAEGSGPTLDCIILNPLTGLPGQTKGGEPSFRADSCVAAFRYCLVEFDNLSRADQLAFWAGLKGVPIVALIDSGNKSIHGWLRVDAADADEWERNIRHKLFRGLLGPLGADTACANPARLARLPGVRRRDTGRWQRLLYLAPEGRAV